MAIIYNTIYAGEFCNSFGDLVQVAFKRRMSDASPIPIPIEIIFAGENDSPVTIEYPDNGEYKLVPVNGSEATFNIKAIGDFELASMYTADEREWLAEVTGARTWSGWIIPDSCSEPFMSKPYDVTIRATDSLGTLKDIPFQKEDGTVYVGHYRDREVLRLALQQTGLSMDLLVALNTFEVNMNDTLDTGPLGQSYINVARFLDSDLVPFSCYDVIASILRRWSSRLHQHNGKWQVVNVLEKSIGNIPAKIYDRSAGGLAGSETLGNYRDSGGQDRVIHPIGSSHLAKAFLASTAYYQFGLVGNELLNGDFNDYDPLVDPLPTHWIANGGVSANTGVRLAPDGSPTTDYYLIIHPGGTNSYVYNDTPVQVRAGQTVTVSFDLYASSAASPVGDRIIEIRLKDNLGKYMTNTGWGTDTKWYEVRFSAQQFNKQINVSFDLQKQPTDYTLEIGLFALWNPSSLARYDTNINNANVRNSSGDSATQPAIGTIFREEQFAPQSYTQESVLLLHSDDNSPSRTSPIMIYTDDSAITLPAGMGVNSSAWARNTYVSENLPLLNIVADTELVLHSRPYRVFEAEFVPTGFEEIDINTLLTVDLIGGNFIFLSGTFDWKKDIHTLRFAEVLTDDVDNFTTLKEDYGKEKTGSLVSAPSGISGGSGGTFVDLSNYALLTDLPVKADDTETQTGTDDDKFVTPLKLKNWWTWVKTQANSISGLWTFTNNVGVGVTPAATRLHVKETSTTTGAGAGLTIEQGGTGDSLLQFILTGVARWVAGVDNSDSDKFKIGRGTDWSTGTDIAVLFSNGNVGIGNASPTEKLDVTGKARVSLTPTNATDVLRLTDLGLGWALYTDTANTSGSPLVVNSGATSTITNNAATIINSELPLGVTSWYDSSTNKVTPSLVGDSYILNVRFTAVSSSNTGLADVTLNVTGLGVITAQTISLRKGSGSSQRINVIFDVYSLATFVANGGTIQLNSLDGNTSIYDISWKITRVYKAI